jgi:histidine ammonia-lyase
MEFRRPNTFSKTLEENLCVIREKVDKLEEDRLLKPDIDAMIKLVVNRELMVNV